VGSKIWELKQIQRLAETDVTKTPPSRYHVASQCGAQLASAEVEIAQRLGGRVSNGMGFKVGDQVEVISERHGVELVGQTGTVTAGTKLGAAVEVNNRLRYFCVDELAAVSTLHHALTLSRRRKRESVASIQPPVLVPAYPYPQGRKGQRPTGNLSVTSLLSEKQLALTTVGASSASDNDDDNSDF